MNEIAPRVHNSGHHTIEACETSQFEQHLRAITSLPLGSSEMKVIFFFFFEKIKNKNQGWSSNDD